MSVKDGLLALLDRGDSYGYQLKVDFEEATGGVWTLNVGQVYTSLARLERDGLVRSVPGDGGDEDRKCYAATAAGRERLSAWLAEPEARTVEARDEVAMKILLAAATPGRDPHLVIRAQRDATMQALQAHTRRKARGGGGLAEVVHLDRLILTCKAELDWLDLTEARIDSRAAVPHPGGAPAMAPRTDPDHDGPQQATQGATS